MIFQIVVLAYLGGNAIYLLFFAVCGRFKPGPKQNSFIRFRHITIILTAFKEDEIIDNVIKSALQQDYPEEMVQLHLVADSFKDKTLERLRSFPLKLIVADFTESTKVRSLNLALEYLPPETEIVVVLDADNIMESDFLRKLNLRLESGAKVIQCHRVAKNVNTPFALLDAISEEANNNIFRQGHVAVGLASALIGSAMAFGSDVFRKYIPQLQAIGGFDKELELKLLSAGIFIDYLPDAYVLDEKVQSSKIFYNQRKRWMRSQLYYFGRDFFPSLRALITEGNINYFDKTLQFSLLPRVLLLGLLLMVNFLDLFIHNPGFDRIWLAAFSAAVIAILISTPGQYFRKETIKAILYLPVAFFLMFSILFRMRKANRHFIHTEHHIQSL
jgi:cellulose synthase/poly-beta-1,6-N-acetylglucosamine synthase-like glycosyltransferase